MRSDLQPFGDDLLRGAVHGDRGQPDRPAGMRAGGEFVAVGVAGDETDVVVLDPQPLAEKLGVTGLMPLPARQRADLDLDKALREYRHDRLLRRRTALRLDIGAKANAAIAAA